MAGLGKYTKGAKFTLKSGNDTSFKKMGSSPYLDKDPHTGENPTHGEHKSIKETIIEGEKKGWKMVWDAATGKWVRDVAKKVVGSIPISFGTVKREA